MTSMLVRSLCAVLVLSAPTAAHAYGWDTHQEIVERAVEAMQTPSSVLNPVPPDGVSQTAFDQYLAAVRAAPTELAKLRTGLPSKMPSAGVTPIPGVSFGNDSYPFAVTTRYEEDPANPSGPQIAVTHIPNCTFDSHDNLSDLNQFTIGSFDYFPRRTADDCGLEDAKGESSLGRVMGWHAGSVDDHLDDSVMWFKPTNSGFLSVIKDLATQGATAFLGALIAPFYCIVLLFGGDACDPDDIFALASKYNPVELIDGWIPGFGDVRSDLFTGLWHFIHVEESPGDFNEIPGMYYPEAGTDYPGAFDVALIAATDLSGMSLNAYASDGDDKYGDYDEVNRLGPGPWMAYSMAHIEFSPLDNLAQYGWDRYRDNPTSAAALAWPLHAIGDAAAPQHVVGTSSWGHVPLEEAVDSGLEGFLSDDWAIIKDPQMERILTEGYRWYVMLHNDQDMEAFIEALAQETRDRVSADGDWAYRDSLTLLQLGGAGALAEALYVLESTPEIVNLLDLSAGAAIAVLAVAAEHVDPLGDGAIACGTGEEFKINEGCVTVPAPSNCNSAEPPCTTVSECPHPAESVCATDGCCRIIVQ